MAPLFAGAEESTFLGPSGLIYTPSTKVVEKKKLNLGMWFDNNDFGSFSFVFGVGEGIEIGACEEIPKDEISHTSLNLNWALTTDKVFYPAVSLGIRDKWNYLATSKDFAIFNGGYVSLGLGTEDFEHYRIFGGIKINIHKEWAVITEYNEGSINSGIRIPYIGILGAGVELNSDEHNDYFWGYTYQIDLK
jgi:hypothetical protein